MSYISFRTKNNSVNIHGTERFYLGALCEKISFIPLSFHLDEYNDKPSILRNSLSKDSWVSRTIIGKFEQTFKTWFNTVSDNDYFEVNGRNIKVSGL